MALDPRETLLPLDQNECRLLLQSVSLSEQLAVKLDRDTGGDGHRTSGAYADMKRRLEMALRLLEAKQTVAELEQKFANGE